MTFFIINILGKSNQQPKATPSKATPPKREQHATPPKREQPQRKRSKLFLEENDCDEIPSDNHDESAKLVYYWNDCCGGMRVLADGSSQECSSIHKGPDGFLIAKWADGTMWQSEKSNMLIDLLSSAGSAAGDIGAEGDQDDPGAEGDQDEDEEIPAPLNPKAEKKRVYSRAYHSKMSQCKAKGKLSIDEAKCKARDAGRRAVAEAGL